MPSSSSPELDGRAAGEVELDGADVDVGLEPGEPVGVAGAADVRGDARRVRVEQGRGTLGRDQVVGAGAA